MEWIQGWVLIILVSGNMTVVGQYSTLEACNEAGAAWKAPRPGVKLPPDYQGSTGRNYMCLPAQIQKKGGENAKKRLRPT